MAKSRTSLGWRRAGIALRALAVFVLALAGPSAAHADAAFERWLAGVRAEAAAPPYNVSPAVLESAFKGVTPDLKLPDLVLPGQTPKSSGQAEFTKSPRAYLDPVLLSRLGSQGRDLVRQHAATVDRIESVIGVDRHIVLAIWGRETAFGTHKLPHYAIRVLATQAYLGRRKDLFRTELLFALKMLEDRIVTVDAMRSSWAGAMGLTQFMPSEFYQSARSLDGRRPDLFRSIPDALASAAEQLRLKGWVTGLPWGFEVVVPAGADCALEGPDQARPLSAWARLGFKRTGNRPLPAAHQSAEAYLMSPAGAFGPAFLVTENYKVIRRYNMSDLYATFVGHLADRIAGGGDFDTPWKEIAAMPESEVAAIQQHLQRRGLAIEKIDGKVGSNTRRLIGTYQRQSKLAVDCWPTRGLLQHLTAGAPAR
ncbi:MAG: lytic murein transglycosylase [Hyphomicrobiaceae bacterium]